MVSSKANTVKEYLASLPADRRGDIETVRKLVLDNLPPGYEEGMQYGMIGYYIPLARYPETYNKQPLGIVAIASQKNYMSVYLLGVYMDPAEQKAFESGWKKSGKKLDMGKSCLRFKSVDDLALDVLAKAVAAISPERYIELYEKARGISGGGKAAAKKAPAKKAIAKKAAAKKSPAKKAMAKKAAAKRAR